MIAELSIPDNLRSARDAAIAGILAGTPDLEAEKALKQWVISDRAYEMITDGGDTGIGMLCDLRYSDLDIRDQLGIDAEDVIGPQELAQFARLMMEYARADSCGPYLEAHTISDGLGRLAVIGLTALAAGQGGMEFTWQGVFPDQAAFIDSIRDSGCAVDSWLPGDKTFDTYSDDDLVALMGRARTVFEN